MARLAAAIEIISTAHETKRPVLLELSQWQRQNRYAGSRDKAAIYAFLKDCYRFRGEVLAIAGDDSPRLLVFGIAIRHGNTTLEQLLSGFEKEKYAPDPLSDEELSALKRLSDPVNKPQQIWDEANLPQWIWEKLVENFDDAALEEAKALCTRPPVDTRVNTLKASMDRPLKTASTVVATSAQASLTYVKVELHLTATFPLIQRSILKSAGLYFTH